MLTLRCTGAIFIFTTLYYPLNGFQNKLLANFLESLAAHYNVRNLVMFQPQSRDYIEETVRLGRSIAMDLKRYMVFVNESLIVEYLSTVYSTLVFFYSSPKTDLNAVFEFINKLDQPSKYIWVIFSESVTNKNLSNLYIPYDCEFIVAKPNSETSLQLTTIYNIDNSSTQYSCSANFWDTKKGITGLSLPLSSRRSNLRGVELRVRPMYDVSGGLWTRQKDFFPGNWKSIANRLNITSNYVGQSDATFELDIAANTYHYDPNVFCFPPSVAIRINLFYREPKEILVWDKYVQPFNVNTWLVTFGWSFLFCTFGAIVFHLLQTKEFGSTADNGFIVFNAIYILLQQGSASEFSSWAGRITSFLQNIGSFIIFGAYSAVFISFITVTVPTIPFRTLEEIIENGRYNIVAVKATPFIKGNNHPTFQKLYKNHLEPEDQKPGSFLEGFQLVCSSSKKLLTELTVKTISVMRKDLGNCHIADNSIPLLNLEVGWMIRRHSPYNNIILAQYLKLMEAGTIGELIWSRDLLEKSFDKVQVIPPTSIRFLEVMPLFVVLLLGISLAAILMGVEVFYKRWIDNKSLNAISCRMRQGNIVSTEFIP